MLDSVGIDLILEPAPSGHLGDCYFYNLGSCFVIIQQSNSMGFFFQQIWWNNLTVIILKCSEPLPISNIQKV